MLHELELNQRNNFSCVFSFLLGDLLGPTNPLTMHFAMFVPAILGQATLEQQGDWLDRAWNFEILGTYAQVKFFNDFLCEIHFYFI